MYRDDCLCLFLTDVTVTTGEYIVYCSNTSDSWVNGILLYKGERPTKDINVFAVCRYVIYLPPADSGVDVCEIEIGGKAIFVINI